MSTSYELVVQRIVKSEYLKENDHVVIERITYALSLDGPAELTDIDTKIKMQMDIEADIIYLLGEYEDLLYRYDDMLDRIEAARRLDLPDRDGNDRKYNEADRAALLTINQDVQKLRAKQHGAKSLSRDIDRLAKIVFRRNDKLDLLTVNYRREIAADANQ